MKRRTWLDVPLAIAIAACLTSRSAECQDAPAPARNHIRVLSLDTLPSDSPWITITEPIYRQRLGDALGDGLQYHYERIDVYNFPDSSYESEFEAYLLRKYHDRPFDLLLVGGVTAAAFAGRLQARLAGHPPIVFQGRFDERPVPKSAGVNLEFAIRDSLGLALRMHPKTRHVFIVNGAGPVDKYYDDQFQSQLARAPLAMDVIYLRGLSVPALVARLADLPTRSVVLLVSLTSDSDGRQIRSASEMGRLAAASAAPIYSWSATNVGIGAFGGRLLSAERVAEETIRIALRVLRGERPEGIPLTTVPNVDTLDWRQLDRWGVTEAGVPRGVQLLFREPSVFERYRSYILGAIALIVLQALLIGGLLIQRRNRRRAERSLRANEAALRHSHSEIRNLAGRLITAQEEERARIARDLHDDFGQQLAAISIAISGCRREPELRANDELLGVLTAAQHQTIALAEDIRLLSHELHPGALRHAGLVDAVRSHCSEVARQHALDVDVEADEDIAGNDPETTLCLYRIVQEALRNIAKHAGARRVRVTVRRVDAEVRLAVTDDGRGFDLAKTRQEGAGLGLRSIDERVRLMGGRLSIESVPSVGTTITVWVKATASTVREVAQI